MTDTITVTITPPDGIDDNADLIDAYENVLGDLAIVASAAVRQALDDALDDQAAGFIVESSV